MEPIHASFAQKAQELRKYFAPYDPTLPEPGTLNSRIYDDGVLQSIAESVMWKLGASRAIVSLVDRNIQYYLAGSIREENDEKDINPRLWFGQSASLAADGFCFNTLETPSGSIYIIKDLSHDPRFESLPIVNGSIASLGFYAGAPILTDRGITIGSLYVVDHKPREAGLSTQQARFLSISALRVMQYLEVAREAATRPRLTLMSRGIAIFLERKAQIVQDIADSKLAREVGDKRERGLKSTRTTSISTPIANHADQVKRTFQLAAELLKTSFNISEGGVAFFDTIKGFDDLVTTGSRKVGWAKGSSYDSSIGSFKKKESISPTEEYLKTNSEQPHAVKSNKEGQTRSNFDLLCPARLIADVSNKEFLPEELDIRTMESLINRYPDGTVWYFDDEGFFSSSLEQEEVIRSFPTVALAVETLAKEAKEILKRFPGTRQLIFLPLWDFIAKRWCASCFIWSHSSFPVFTVDCEVAYLSAFTNSVMSEISRLDAIKADEIKGEFIGSMSHEFRSPLHGILASAEFLTDTNHDRSQSMLISTIHNCGRTLLDTVNHLLDYSRLDTLNKELAVNLGTGDQFIPNPLYCITNIAALCEEVIDGMIMSSGFEDITEPDPEAMTARTISLMTHLNTLPSRIDQISLPVMLEMEHRNWSIFTQPGAIRRILMNVFGNSIKYTKSGFIRITLASEKIPPVDAQTENVHLKDTILKLTVQDSGCGMSADFLQKSLYTPFIQENILAPGVGLGLSITRNIVEQLGGTIDIQSSIEEGQSGTSVEIRLPFNEALEPTPGQSTQIEIDDEYFGAASQVAMEKVIALRRSPTMVKKSNGDNRKPSTIELVAQYLTHWLDFRVKWFDDWTEEMRADVVILEEHGESEPFADLLGLPGIPPILVICNLASCVEQNRAGLPYGIAGFISIPVGPRKLAKILLQHFRSMAASTVASSPFFDVQTRTFEESLQVKGSTITISNVDVGISFESLPENKGTALAKNGLRSRSASSGGITEFLSPTSALQVDASIATNQAKFIPRNPTPISAQRPLLLSAATSYGKVPRPQISNTDLKSGSGRTPLKILAVDDNEINLALIRRYLDKRTQDEVDYAINGLEAFYKVTAAAELPQGGYDVIFMDLNMPIMNGFDSVRRIREFEATHFSTVAKNARDVIVAGAVACSEGGLSRESSDASDIIDGMTSPCDGVMGERSPRSYIIALTGLSNERDRKEAVICGIDAFLTKPVRFKNVGKILEERCWLKSGQNRGG